MSRHAVNTQTPTGRRQQIRRTNVSVTAAATLVALWLGLTAPQVSPVAPTAPPAVATTPLAPPTPLTPVGRP